MILVDTSIWIEFLRQSNQEINEILAKEIENGNVIALSPVFGELLQGVRNVREEKLIIDLWEDLHKVNEEQLFVAAGRLSYEHKLMSKGVGLIDCAILAAAKANRLEIWSLDKKVVDAGKALSIASHSP